MKPIAAETLKGMPVSSKAMMPPINPSGTLTRMSKALLKLLKASNNRMKMRKVLIGTMMANRFMARC